MILDETEKKHENINGVNVEQIILEMKENNKYGFMDKEDFSKETLIDFIVKNESPGMHFLIDGKMDYRDESILEKPLNEIYCELEKLLEQRCDVCGETGFYDVKEDEKYCPVHVDLFDS